MEILDSRERGALALECGQDEDWWLLRVRLSQSIAVTAFIADDEDEPVIGISRDGEAPATLSADWDAPAGVTCFLIREGHEYMTWGDYVPVAVVMIQSALFSLAAVN